MAIALVFMDLFEHSLNTIIKFTIITNLFKNSIYMYTTSRHSVHFHHPPPPHCLQTTLSQVFELLNEIPLQAISEITQTLMFTLATRTS